MDSNGIISYYAKIKHEMNTNAGDRTRDCWVKASRDATSPQWFLVNSFVKWTG